MLSFPGAVRVVTVALGASLLLSGCGALRTVTAPPGQRPGVDVPSTVGDVAPAPLGTPPPAPAGQGGFTYLMTHDDGTPVTFDPCRPIRYVVRPTREPANGRRLLREALAEVSAATGLQFVEEGETDEAPTEDRAAYQRDRYGDRWAPVLVAWGTPLETPMLQGATGGGGREPLGRAGPLVAGDGADLRYVSGIAVFNGPALDAQLRMGEDDKARAVLLHELGHLVGLGHVADPYQVMYDTNLWPLPSYRAGDLRGLAELGLGRCTQNT